MARTDPNFPSDACSAALKSLEEDFRKWHAYDLMPPGKVLRVTLTLEVDMEEGRGYSHERKIQGGSGVNRGHGQY